MEWRLPLVQPVPVPRRELRVRESEPPRDTHPSRAMRSERLTAAQRQWAAPSAIRD